VLLAGCTTRTLTSAWQPDARMPETGSSLAVVPFENLSSSRNAGLVLTDLATSLLYAERAFKVVELGGLAEDQGQVLRRMEIAPWERQVGLNTATAASVGKALQTDYVLVGSVGEYGFVDGFGETATVGVNLRLLHVEEERVAWAGALSRRAACTAFSEESVHRLGHEVLRELLGQMVRTMDELRRTDSRAEK
jgi:TolB-like protein